MKKYKFLTRDKLVEYLDDEVRENLNAQGIYDLSQYGWLDNEIPDDEYLGLALWQTHPPDLQKLLTAGKSFEGLMHSARHSIGMASLYHDPSNSFFGQTDYCFWYNLADAIHKLALASDRLREFFMTAFDNLFENLALNWMGQDAANHEQDPSLYCAPFYLAAEFITDLHLTDTPLGSCLVSLAKKMELVTYYRLGSEDHGLRIHSFREELASLAVSGHSPGEHGRSKENHPAGPSTISSWYKILVEAGNLVFLSENLHRQSLTEH